MATTNQELDPQEEMRPEFLREREKLGRPDVENPDKKDNRPAGDPSDPRGGLGKVEAAGGNTPGGKAKEDKPESGSFYRSKTDTGDGNSASRSFRLLGSRKRLALFGGGGIGAITVIVLILSFTSGPLQFIHIAQLMERFHLHHQENAGNDRTGRLFRYVRSGGDVGETRLGYLGSKMKTRMLAQLDEIGLKPIYNKSTIFQGFEIDRSNPESPYYNQTPEEVQQALKSKGINPKEVSIAGDKVSVSVSGYIQQRRSLAFLSDELHSSIIPGAIRVRVLARYGLVTWHPMKRLDIALNSKLQALYDKWQKDRETRLKTGVESGVSDGTNGKEEKNTGKNGKPVIEPAPGERSGDFQKILSDISASKSLRITGGVATAVGLVCIVKSVNDNIGLVRYFQIIAPLTRVGMDALTIGSQMMNRQDVSATEVDFLAKNFSDGTTTWNQSQSILAQEGLQGGTPMDPTVKKNINQGAPDYISWVNGIPGVGELCSGAGSAITGIVSFAVGIFSGGIVSTIGSLVASALAGPYIIGQLTSFLSGQAVNVLAKGAMWGNYVDYGVRLGANAAAFAFGGVALTAAQEAQINSQVAAEDQAQFNSQSVVHKLFSPTDDRSLVGRAIDGTSSSPVRNFAKMGSAFLHFGGLFSAIGNIFGGKAHADPTPLPYDYGFPAYGYSQEDLNNPMVADPYDNAKQAATILDNNPSYVDKAKQCFGVKLEKIANDPDGVSRWDVIPGNSGLQSQGGDQPNPYDPAHYNPTACVDAGNNDWLRVRFFIFDTAEMEGYACFNGDDVSCQNDGFDNSTTGTTGSSSASSNTAPSSANGYEDPFHGCKVSPSRIDQGVDYSGTCTVYPIGNGVVDYYSTSVNWSGGNFISYKLTDQNLAAHDKEVYVAEYCTLNPALHKGSQVNPNTPLCTMTGGGIETGWAEPGVDDGVDRTLPVKCYDKNNSTATVYGINFSNLMKALGAPPGIKQDPTSCQDPKTGDVPQGWPTW